MAAVPLRGVLFCVWLALLVGRVEAQEVWAGRYIVKAKYDFCDWVPHAGIHECILIKAGETYDVSKLPGTDVALLKAPADDGITSYDPKNDLCKTTLKGMECEPDYVVRIFSDPLRIHQWAHDAVGITKPLDASGINIAIIDSGGDCTHEDIRCDYEYNAITGEEGPGAAKDENGHGTHVHGIIAAITGNGVGVAGASVGANIAQYKFIGASGAGSTFAAIGAIDRAVQQGAQVINASWGGGARSDALASAIARAQKAGIIFIAASGNNGRDNEIHGSYPANYEDVVSVGSIDSTGAKSSFSNYSKKLVDIAAPGGGIVSTYPGQQYRSLSGTSMAAPLYAAVVAAEIKLRGATQAVQSICNQADKKLTEYFECGVLKLPTVLPCQKKKCKQCIDQCNKAGVQCGKLKKCRAKCRKQTQCGAKCEGVR